MAMDVRVALDCSPREEIAASPLGESVHVRASPPGGLDVEVDRNRGAGPRAMEEHRAAASETRHEGLDHGHGERGSDRSIDRVAATPKDFRAHAGTDGVTRRHAGTRYLQLAFRDEETR